MSGSRARLRRKAAPPVPVLPTSLIAYFDLHNPNLLLQSETFSHASWTKTRSFIAANCAADPLTGLYTVDKLVEDGTAANSHYTEQARVFAAGIHVLRVVCRAGGRGALTVVANDGTATRLSAKVDLASLVVTASVGSGSAQVVGGSVECRFTTLEAVAGTGWVRLMLTDATTTYSGLGHQGVAAAGGNTTTAVLAAGASTVDDVYSHYFAAASANKNLVWPRALSNFENGWTSNCMANAGGVVTYDATNGVDGSGCAKLAATNALDGILGPIPSGYPMANGRVTPGAVYSLSVSIKGAVGGETGNLYLLWYDATGATLGQAQTAVTVTNAHARYKVENATALVGAAIARFGLYQTGATARTFYVDELQIEQAAAATSYLAPTRGALWSDAGAKVIFSDAPTVEHSVTGYNGGTKTLTFTPARASAPDGTTYTVGPGIYIARVQLGEGTSLLPYEETTTRQTITSQFGKPYTVIRGADTGATTTDPTLRTGSMSFDGGDYLKGGESQPAWSHGFDVAWYAPAAVNAALAQQYLVGLLGSNTDGMYIGNGALTNEIIALVQEGGTPTAAWCHASDELAVGWHVAQWTWTGAAWRLFVDGAEKTLTTAGTQAKFTTAGVPFIGSTKVPGTYLAAGTLVHAVVPYSAPRSVSELARCRRYIKGQAAIAGVSLP